MTDPKAENYSITKTLLISLLIIAAGVAFTWVIFSTEPQAKREGATKKTPMLVEVKPLSVGDYTPTIEAMGTVMPARDIQLQARVGGQVTATAENFIPGMIVKQGAKLLELDPQDYQIAVQQRQSELDQAQADLDLEMGEQMAAERDYQRLDRDVTTTQKSLILRAPQLARAEAQVTAARSALNQALINLQRTSVVAPFDASIQNIYANLGSQVNVGNNLAELVGVDTYWIEATLPVDQLVWLNRSQADANTSVKIVDSQAWPAGVTRAGYLISVIGQLDNATRMARVMIGVDDPIGIKDSHLPPLTLGAFVTCHIPAKQLTDVVRIERQYVRKNDTLWVMAEQQLSIRPLDVVFRDQQYVYVRGGVQEGDQMVITDLSRVVDGAALRLNTGQNDES